MTRPYPRVSLSSILRKVEKPVFVEPEEAYKQVTVRLFHKGVVLRGKQVGAEIRTTRQWRVRAGQILLSRIDARNGAIGLVPSDLDGAIVTNDFWAFDVDGAAVEPRFLDAYFGTPEFVDACRRASEGTTNRVRLQHERFLGITVPLPHLAEQRGIVARIEELAAKIEEARTLRRQSAQAAEALVLSGMSRAFDRFSQHPRGAIRTLGIDGESPVQTGPFGAQLHASEFVSQGVPVLNVGNVWPEGLRLDRLDRVLPEKAAQLSRYSLRPGDLLFARSGATLGKVCIVPDQCDGWLITGHLFRVRFDQTRIYSRFAFAALRGVRTIRDQVFGQVRGATRPGYNTTLLGNIEIPVPPLSEQRRVVDYLDKLEAVVGVIKHLHAETAAELDALLPSILDRAFKGEL